MLPGFRFAAVLTFQAMRTAAFAIRGTEERNREITRYLDLQTIAVVVSNVLADLLFGVLDPRVRLGGEEEA